MDTILKVVAGTFVAVALLFLIRLASVSFAVDTINESAQKVANQNLERAKRKQAEIAVVEIENLFRGNKERIVFIVKRELSPPMC